jgi:hypothetical protein
MRRDLALAEFRLLTPEKQRLCRAAIPLFAIGCSCGSAVLSNSERFFSSRSTMPFTASRQVIRILS